MTIKDKQMNTYYFDTKNVGYLEKSFEDGSFCFKVVLKQPPLSLLISEHDYLDLKKLLEVEWKGIKNG